MELVSTMEISGEEREIADAYARGQIDGVNSNLIDLKMLGWTVPKECPIQNYVDSNGVFHQLVGRLDLGSLNWRYETKPNRFNANFNSVKFVNNTTPIVAYSTKYDIYSFNTAINKDKAIGAYGSNGIAIILAVLDSSYTDADTFKNAMQGVYLYYELATPITMTIDGNEVTERINESLDDYGLNNLYHGTLAKQSYINGSWTPGEKWVRTVDKTPCKGGDIVSVKTAKTWDMMYILFFESDDTFIEAGAVGSLKAKTDAMSAIAPSNASYFMCQFGCEASGSHATVNDIIHTYVNNGIDKIKNDLSEKLKVISVSLSDVMVSAMSSTTVDLPQEYIDAGYVIANILSKPDTGLNYTTGSETSIIIRNNTDSAVAFSPTTTVKVLIAKIG